uniref:Putative secreted protein n=1 Tax=Anopheles marajoara TaxID=58244 RepID=A0A2M4CDK6_9DIPT
MRMTVMMMMMMMMWRAFRCHLLQACCNPSCFAVRRCRRRHRRKTSANGHGEREGPTIRNKHPLIPSILSLSVPEPV